MICTMRWKKKLRYTEYPNVDTIEMELGQAEVAESGQSAVGRGLRMGKCDRQNFRSLDSGTMISRFEAEGR